MLNIVHRINVDIYGQTIFLSFSKDALQNRFGLKDELFDGFGGFCCIHESKEGKVFIIYIQDQNGCICMGTVSHEAFHAIDFIFDHCGVCIQEGTGNEHFAYPLGWLVGEILKAGNREHDAEVRLRNGKR